MTIRIKTIQDEARKNSALDKPIDARQAAVDAIDKRDNVDPRIAREQATIIQRTLPSSDVKLFNEQKAEDVPEINTEASVTMPRTKERDKKIAEGQPIPLKSMANQSVGSVDDDGNASFVDTDIAKIELARKEKAKQKEGIAVDSDNPAFFEYDNAEELKTRLTQEEKPAPYSGMVNSIVDTGKRFSNFFDILSPKFAMDNTEVAIKAKNFLIDSGLGAQTDGGTFIFDRKVPNGLSIQLISVIQDYVNRKAFQIIGEGKQQTAIDESAFLNFDYEESDLAVSGEKLNPDYVTGDLAREVFNLIVKNPNKQNIKVSEPNARKEETMEMYSALGGAGNAMDSEVMSYLDTQLWSVVNDAGYISKYTGADGITEYVINEQAIDYHISAGSYLKIANKRNRVGVSLTKPLEGMEAPYESRIAGKGKSSSVKTHLADNAEIEGKTKDHLSSVDFQINSGIDRIATQISEHVIGKIPFVNGVPDLKDFKFPDSNDTEWQIDPTAVIPTDEELIAQIPEAGKQTEKDQAYMLKRLKKEYDEGQNYSWGPVLFSTSIWAKGLGLDKTKWLKAYRNAARNEELNQNEAVNQANIVMMSELKSVLIDLKDSKQNIKNVFYNKFFDATANGRYHIRNNELNPQDSKLVRNLISNANAKTLDLEKLSNEDKEYLDDALYVIGYNILPGKMTKNVKTSNMGINAIMDATRRVLSQSNEVQKETYKEWLSKGKILRAMSEKTSMNTAMIYELENYGKAGKDKVGTLIKDIFSKKADWGMTVQAHIDFANYHDAKEALRKKRKRKSLGNEGIEYIAVENKDSFLPENEAEITEIQNAILEAKEVGNTDEVDILTSRLTQLSNAISFEAAPLPITTFKPQALMEIDGKQSGIAIQAKQTGDMELLKLVGMMYATEDNIIPQGDIRDLFAQRATLAIGGVFSGDTEKIALWTNIFKDIKSNKDSSEITKELVKQPLMETSYGKSRKFHYESAINFIEGEYGDVVTERIKNVSNSMPDYDVNEAADDLKRIIAETLGLTLDLDHQQLMKDTGLMFSMLGVTPSFKGPLGTTVWMGSKEFQESGKTISVATSRGYVEVKLGSVKSSGNKRSKITKILDEKTKNYRNSEPTPYGQEVNNQFPVLSIQVIDAAIIAIAINRVNAFRKGNRYKSAKFVLPIHDAIIADASSIRAYHAAVNKAFDDVNDSWHPTEAIAQGLKDANNEVFANLKDNKTYSITAESYRWRSLYAYIEGVITKSKEAKLKNQNYNDNQKAFIRKLINNGWNVGMINNTTEGVKLTGSQLKQIIMEINTHLTINSRLKTQINKDNRARASFNKEKKKQQTYFSRDTNGSPVMLTKANQNYTFN